MEAPLHLPMSVDLDQAVERFQLALAKHGIVLLNPSNTCDWFLPLVDFLTLGI